MVKNATGECNHCGKVSRMKSKVKRLKDRVKKHYFQCEHCDQVYVIGYTDEAIDRERKRMNKLRKKNGSSNLYVNQIQTKTNQIERMMAELRAKVEQGGTAHGDDL